MDNEVSIPGADRFKRIIKAAPAEPVSRPGEGGGEGSILNENESRLALARLEPKLTPEQLAEKAEANLRMIQGLPPKREASNAGKVLATSDTDQRSYNKRK